MDTIKLTMQGSSSRKSHHSDEIAFTIKPYEVAPPPPPIPWATILGALLVGGIIYIATRPLGG